MWCAPIAVEEEDEKFPPTDNFEELQRIAKLSAMAIPLWYIIGKGKPNSNKYCVITNWWRYRMKNGVYGLATLDPKLYQPLANDSDWRLLLVGAGRPPSTENEFGEL